MTSIQTYTSDNDNLHIADDTQCSVILVPYERLQPVNLHYVWQLADKALHADYIDQFDRRFFEYAITDIKEANEKDACIHPYDVWHNITEYFKYCDKNGIVKYTKMGRANKEEALDVQEKVVPMPYSMFGIMAYVNINEEFWKHWRDQAGLVRSDLKSKAVIVPKSGYRLSMKYTQFNRLMLFSEIIEKTQLVINERVFTYSMTGDYNSKIAARVIAYDKPYMYEEASQLLAQPITGMVVK